MSMPVYAKLKKKTRSKMYSVEMQIDADAKGKSCSGWHHSVGQPLYEVSWKYHFYRATLCVSAVFSVARCLSVYL